MPERLSIRVVTPMIHVPDVRKAAQWYESIGFAVDETFGDGGEGLSFAILSAGSSRIMLNQGGPTTTAERREVDLYIEVADVDALFSSLKDEVEIVERPHDTHYQMREFIIRDLNGFWITFGQDRPALDKSPGHPHNHINED